MLLRLHCCFCIKYSWISTLQMIPCLNEPDVCMLRGGEKGKIADPAKPLSAGRCTMCGFYCGMLEQSLGVTRPDLNPSSTSYQHVTLGGLLYTF